MFYIRGIEVALVTPGSGIQSGASSTITGASQDFGASDDIIACIQSVGTVTGTTPTLAGKLQNSADGSTAWADCPAVSALTTVTASNNNQVGTYQRDLRYVRYVGTIGGTTPVFPFNAIIVGEKKKI